MDFLTWISDQGFRRALNVWHCDGPRSWTTSMSGWALYTREVGSLWPTDPASQAPDRLPELAALVRRKSGTPYEIPQTFL